MKATVIWGGVFDVKINQQQASLLNNEAIVCKCMKTTVIWGGVFDAKINKKYANLLKKQANVCECVTNVLC